MSLIGSPGWDPARSLKTGLYAYEGRLWRPGHDVGPRGTWSGKRSASEAERSVTSDTIMPLSMSSRCP